MSAPRANIGILELNGVQIRNTNLIAKVVQCGTEPVVPVLLVNIGIQNAKDVVPVKLSDVPVVLSVKAVVVSAPRASIGTRI